MNSPHCSGFSDIKMCKNMPFLNFDAINGYDVLHFDTDDVEERRKWTAVFSYDRLPC